jgi:hypothetical protein
LGAQFWNLQGGERLTGMNTVANVNEDFADIARDLGVDVDHLVRLKLTSDAQHMRDIAALRDSHSDCAYRRRLFPVGVVAAAREYHG